MIPRQASRARAETSPDGYPPFLCPRRTHCPPKPSPSSQKPPSTRSLPQTLPISRATPAQVVRRCSCKSAPPPIGPLPPVRTGTGPLLPQKGKHHHPPFNNSARGLIPSRRYPMESPMHGQRSARTANSLLHSPLPHPPPALLIINLRGYPRLLAVIPVTPLCPSVMAIPLTLMTSTSYQKRLPSTPQDLTLRFPLGRILACSTKLPLFSRVPLLLSHTHIMSQTKHPHALRTIPGNVRLNTGIVVKYRGTAGSVNSESPGDRRCWISQITDTRSEQKPTAGPLSRPLSMIEGENVPTACRE